MENVVRDIENEQHRFYTQNGISTAWVAVRKSSSGRKFIQTTQMVSGMTTCSPSTSARPSSTAYARERFLIEKRVAKQFSSADRKDSCADASKITE
ncbi:hypothetical protein [Bradyrhizobium sp. CCBAU 11386]|uniref:hypothetical protein n=1 Tax=Bradyrhizobium sp. CCBAU 11386 TaxID=1630837 RepID=UPI0023038C78|nr:hypothetical protein [Bradyrhizobium sp. CCBAU 11386]